MHTTASSSPRRIPRAFCALGLLLAITPGLLAAQNISVTVREDQGADLDSTFLGLSYESSLMLPVEGRYYFDPNDAGLIRTFRTLGIKSLRVGANGVDDPRFAIPNEKDIDSLFAFARAAGVKVIYSFRLKKGDPAAAAQLAKYIQAKDADLLDSFSIGNEPEYYFKKFPAYYTAWKPYYDAILQQVPNAQIEGPSSSVPAFFSGLADALSQEGHLTLITGHHYFLGGGREGEKNLVATRARFLSNDNESRYEKYYADNIKKLTARNIPFRFDELNSCYNGGSKGASDRYADSLWVLDCTHWWAARGIRGLNYHTGDSVGRDGHFGAPNYSAFVHRTDGPGFVMRPQAYGLLAFNTGAQGKSVKVESLPAANSRPGAPLDFTAYAYRTSSGQYTVTLINKSFGEKGEVASVSLQLPLSGASVAGHWQRMDLAQANQDPAAETGVTLGGAGINSLGDWPGHWKKISVAPAAPKSLVVQVPPASAAIVQFVPLPRSDLHDTEPQ